MNRHAGLFSSSRRTRASPGFLALGLLAAALSAAGAASFGTAFTYQGRLSEGAAPAQGIFDFQFSLFDDPGQDASQVGSTLTNAAVSVSEGFFTAVLDFGPVFTSEPRWLEIGVRSNGNSAFQRLTPRQAVRPVPYALFSGSATNYDPGALLVLSNSLVGLSNATALALQNLRETATSTGNGLMSTDQVRALQLERYALGGPRLPPMGYSLWTVWAWYPTEQIVNGIIDLIKTNQLDALGWKYILLDDLSLGGLYYSNGIPYSPTRFPSGFKALFDRVHANGLKIGWYFDARTPEVYVSAMPFLRTNHCDFVHLDYDYMPPYAGYECLASMLRSNWLSPPFIQAASFGAAGAWSGDIFRIADAWTILAENLDLDDRADAIYPGFKIAAEAGRRLRPGSFPHVNAVYMGTNYYVIFGLSCLFSAPLTVGGFDLPCDPIWSPTTNQPSCSTNTELIAIDQDPLAAAPQELRDTNALWVICKPLSSGQVALGLYNHDHTQTLATVVGMAECGLPSVVRVRDVLAGRDLGLTVNTFTPPAISPGELKIYTLTPPGRYQLSGDASGVTNLPSTAILAVTNASPGSEIKAWMNLRTEQGEVFKVPLYR